MNASDSAGHTPSPAPVTSATEAGAEAKPARKTPPKSARRRSRELALQGLYEWQLGKSAADVVSAHMREQDDFDKCDSVHFDALLQGCIAESAELDALLKPCLDRPVSQLSPVEHGVLWLGLYELKHCMDVPYRVAINEAVELAKSFGGTDGHKYVNGVLDRCAADLRPEEARAHAARRGR